MSGPIPLFPPYAFMMGTGTVLPLLPSVFIENNEIGGECSVYGRGERGEAYTVFWWGNLRESDHLGDPRVDGRIILRWIFRKWKVGAWTGSSWLRIGTGGGTCGCGNETSGSIKCGEFLE